MKKEIIENDIKVFCITAEFFPEGVLAAHQSLQRLVAFSAERKYFGISYPDKGGSIIYKAAVTELIPAELSVHGLEEFIIRKGTYVCILIKNFMQDIPAIGKAFQTLLTQPELDPNGACIEWYFNDADVKCMVRVK